MGSRNLSAPQREALLVVLRAQPAADLSGGWSVLRDLRTRRDRPLNPRTIAGLARLRLVELADALTTITGAWTDRAQIRITDAGREEAGEAVEGLIRVGPVTPLRRSSLELEDAVEAVQARGFEKACGVDWSLWCAADEWVVEDAPLTITAGGGGPDFWLRIVVAGSPIEAGRLATQAQIYGVRFPVRLFGMRGDRVAPSMAAAIAEVRDELRVAIMRDRATQALRPVMQEAARSMRGVSFPSRHFGGMLSISPEALSDLLLAAMSAAPPIVAAFGEAATQAPAWKPVADALRMRRRALAAAARLREVKPRRVCPENSGAAVQLAAEVGALAMEAGDEVFALLLNEQEEGLAEGARDIVIEAARDALGYCPICYTLPGQPHGGADEWHASDDGDNASQIAACVAGEVFWGRFAGGVGTGMQGCLLCGVDGDYPHEGEPGQLEPPEFPSAAAMCASARLAIEHPDDDFGPRPGARCMSCGHGRGCSIGQEADAIVVQIGKARADREIAAPWECQDCGAMPCECLDRWARSADEARALERARAVECPGCGGGLVDGNCEACDAPPMAEHGVCPDDVALCVCDKPAADCPFCDLAASSGLPLVGELKGGR